MPKTRAAVMPMKKEATKKAKYSAGKVNCDFRLHSGHVCFHVHADQYRFQVSGNSCLQ